MGTGSSKIKQLKDELEKKINQLQNIQTESKQIIELCEQIINELDEQFILSDQKFRLLKDQKEQLKTKWIELVKNDDEQTLVQNQQDYQELLLLLFLPCWEKRKQNQIYHNQITSHHTIFPKLYQELMRYFDGYPQLDLIKVQGNNKNIKTINQFVLKMQLALNPLVIYKNQNHKNSQRIEQLENEVILIKDQINLHLENILEKNNKLLYLNSQNSNFEQKYQQMATLINNFLNLKNKYLDKKIFFLQEQNKILKETNRDLKETNEELSSNNTQLKQQIEKILNSNYKNKQQINDLVEQINQNKESLQKARNIIDQQEKELQQIKKELQTNQLKNNYNQQQDLEQNSELKLKYKHQNRVDFMFRRRQKKIKIRI